MVVKTEAVIKDEAAVDTSQICTICGREVAETEFWSHVLDRHGLMSEEYQTVADSLKSPKLATNEDDAEKALEVGKSSLLWKSYFFVKFCSLYLVSILTF